MTRNPFRFLKRDRSRFLTVSDKVARAEQDVAEFLRELPVDQPPMLSTFCVDVAALTRHAGMTLQTVNLPRTIVSFLHARDDGLSLQLNRHVGSPKQRFLVAHALGHIYTDPSRSVPIVEHSGAAPGTGNPLCRKMDEFASALLMPERSLKRYLRDRDGETTLSDMSEAFGVDAGALYVRLDRLGMV